MNNLNVNWPRLEKLLGPEQYFNLLCVDEYLYSNTNDRPKKSNAINFEQFNWSHFVQIVDDNRTWPLVSQSFRKVAGDLGLECQISESAVTNWTNNTKVNKARNIVAKQELLELVGNLQSGGVEPVLLKGAVRLIDGLWPKSSDRYIGDLDLLIPHDQLNLATGVVQDLGYKFKSNPELNASKHQLPELVNSKLLMPVELHFEVGIKVLQKRLNKNDFIKRGTIISTQDNQLLKVPAVDHQILHCFYHGSLFFGNQHRKYFPMSDFFELSLLCKRCGEVKEFDLEPNFFGSTFEEYSSSYIPNLKLHKRTSHFYKLLIGYFISSKKKYSWRQHENLLSRSVDMLIKYSYVAIVHRAIAVRAALNRLRKTP